MDKHLCEHCGWPEGAHILFLGTEEDKKQRTRVREGKLITLERCSGYKCAAEKDREVQADRIMRKRRFAEGGWRTWFTLTFWPLRF